MLPLEDIVDMLDMLPPEDIVDMLPLDDIPDFMEDAVLIEEEPE